MPNSPQRHHDAGIKDAEIAKEAVSRGTQPAPSAPQDTKSTWYERNLRAAPYSRA